MKIGIFDSGMSGTTIMSAIKKLLPNEEYLYIADSKNCPYGEKSNQELQKIVRKNVETLKTKIIDGTSGVAHRIATIVKSMI